MWLSAADVHTRFVFDLEFVGNIEKGPSNCRIWEIGCVCVETGAAFKVAMRPPISNEQLKLTAPGIPGITHADLDTMHAVCQHAGFMQWCQWLHNCCTQTGKKTALLISHNCFRSDMAVLSCEFGRYNIGFLQPTMFFDSLLFMRYGRRGKGVSDYSRSGLAVMKGIRRGSQHRALDDAACLLKVLQSAVLPLSGPCAQHGFLPTLVLDSVGVSSYMALAAQCNIYCVRQMLDGVVAKHGTASDIACREYLLSLPFSAWSDVDRTAHSLSQLAGRMAW